MPIKRNAYRKINGAVAIELYYPFTKEIQDYALISEQDVELAKTVFWHKTKFGYAMGYSKQNGKEVHLHKLITRTDRYTIIDHINRNKLDCRRENLRIADKSINSLNRDAQANSRFGISGVSYDKRSRKYRAYAKLEGKQIFLGYHETVEDAILARKTFEKEVIEPKIMELQNRFPLIFDDI